MRDLRSFVVKIVVASFSAAALLGIGALLLGGDLGGVPGQVLGTTVVVGIESVAVLCYLAVAGTRRAWVGVAGGLVSLVPFLVTLWIIWGTGTDGESVARTLGVGVTLAGTLAQVCLLLALAARPRGRAAALLVATLAAIGVVAAMIIVPIVAEPDVGDWYWRLFGVVAILDVLGTILVIVAQRFSDVGERSADPGGPAVLAPAVESRLVEAAHRRGTSPSSLLQDLLDGLPDP